MPNMNNNKRVGLHLMMVAACLAVSGTQADTFTVINTTDNGGGSLRQAIINANNSSGTDTIAFNIPGGGPHTIQPISVLPELIYPVIIDGYTQPGASENTNPVGLGINAVMMIELDGSLARTGVGADGLNLYGGNSIVRGLVINRFDGNGIGIAQGGGNVIEGNFIGTDITGTVAAGNAGDGFNTLGGVQIYSSDNTIGGTTAAARNLISGNNVSGVWISLSADNTVQGNLIGTNATGLHALPNLDGVVTSNTSNTIIGGTTVAARNVISGNFREGVHLGPTTGALPDQVLGNYIGTDITGLSALGNGQNGVRVQGNDNWVGGAEAGAGNVISGNGEYGVALVGGATTDNLVQGNLIGTDATGTVPLGNGRGAGVFIFAVPGNLIGGTTSGAGNVISGNNVGVDIRTAGSVVEGNLIGTDISGTGG